MFTLVKTPYTLCKYPSHLYKGKVYSKIYRHGYDNLVQKKIKGMKLWRYEASIQLYITHMHVCNIQVY